MSSPVRNSYLLIFHDNDANIFVASLLIYHCSFSSLILPPIVTISFYSPSKRFFLKRKELSNQRLVSITENEYGFAVYFYIDP